MSEEIQTQKIYYDARSVTLRTEQIVYFVQEHDKTAMLQQMLQNTATKQIVIVIKSKSKADELDLDLKTKEIKSGAVHGNYRVEQQEKIALAFNAKEINVLITTDMILATLELENIEQLINYDLPMSVQDYFNRVARLKESGNTVSFVSPEDDKILSAIEFNMKEEMLEQELENFQPTPLQNVPKKPKKKKQRHRKMKSKKEQPKED